MKPAHTSRSDSFEEVSAELDEIASQIVDSAFKVHSKLGPGLLENAYEACLVYELQKRGLKVERQKQLPIAYEEVRLDVGYRLDLLVNESVVVELKITDGFHPIQQAQMMTYLKLTGVSLGLIINFNVPLIKQDIRRVVFNPKINAQGDR